MKPETFQSTLADLKREMPSASHPTDDVGDAYSKIYDKLQHKRAVKSLHAAEEAIKDGHSEVAWSYLVQAAHSIGYLIGIRGAEYRNRPEQQLRDQFRVLGKKGGTTKGEKSAALRDKVAEAIIKSAQKIKIRNIEQFDLRYHECAKAVPGFRDTEYQRRKILERDDIQSMRREQAATTTRRALPKSLR